ncbi:MAG: Nif3-like dinuclear metal center hexameric protein [Desulfuromonadales bacterium]|nr:Nif3-like dinuclear metal center hexameric protein [Desulfuromonadales bacterium]
MAKKNDVKLHDIVGLLHALYPPGLAEEWDNVGLQVGDARQTVARLLVSLDPTAAALDAARRGGAQLLVCHHPLIFKPLQSVTADGSVGDIVRQAIKDDIAIVCAHTNLDRAAAGLNDWLAERLGLIDTLPLAAAGDLFKLTVYVPLGHEEAVATALFSAGAGAIGNYDHCSFRTAGTGTFRPGTGSSPFVGTPGTTTQVEEVRLETIVPAEALPRTLKRMFTAHPYEEVAYDVVPLHNRRADIGLGRLGMTTQKISLAAFVDQVKERLEISALRLVGDCSRMVGKVAVCGGSGASLLVGAQRQGADVLVTGDVDYHTARRAEELGIAVIDAGHFATEKIMVRGLEQALRGAAEKKGYRLEIDALTTECDPFKYL